MAAAYRCEPLGTGHDRQAFSCGNETLDQYLRERAGQDQKRGVARCFVFVELASGRIAGYYTLSATSIDVSVLPTELSRSLPRCPTVPAILIGRLARDLSVRRRRVGELLLGNALQRCERLSAELGAIGVIVDAIDDAARGFYERYGFVCFPDRDYTLLLPMSAIRATIGTGGP